MIPYVRPRCHLHLGVKSGVIHKIFEFMHNIDAKIDIRIDIRRR